MARGVKVVVVGWRKSNEINHDAVDVQFRLRSPHKDCVRYRYLVVR